MHVKAHEYIFDVLASWESSEKSSPVHSCKNDIKIGLYRITELVYCKEHQLGHFEHDFLDVSAASTSNGSIRGSKVPPTPVLHENRLYFYRRLFRGSREMSEDPAEIALLYGQAVYCVVHLDQYPINDKVALQLAGLQLQATLGDQGKGTSFILYFTYHVNCCGTQFNCPIGF